MLGLLQVNDEVFTYTGGGGENLTHDRPVGENI